MEIFGLLVFDSTHCAIKAENIVKEEKINARLIGTPESIVAGCGLSLKFQLEDYELVKDKVLVEGIKYKGFYKGQREGFKSQYEELNLD